MTDVTLDMDTETVRSLGYRIIDIVVSELANPSNRPTRPPIQSEDTLATLFAGPLPREGADPDELLSIVQDHLIPATTNLLHPRWLAYVLAGSLPLVGLTGALVSTLNLGPYDPANTRLTRTVTRWLGQMLGFAHDAAGYITTGGSWANLVGLAVARVRRAGWEVRIEGLADHPPLVAYVSEEGHSCLDKGMELLGMGRSQLRKVPVGSDYRILVDALEEAIKADLAAGLQPFCIIGNAGTVNTGAVDPLDTLAELAAHYRLWFHVDGAYGAFAAMVPEAQSLFAGIERADSLAVDPHKWLNIPIEAGCILVRDWSDLTDTFSLVPPYLRAAVADNEINLRDCGFELTRTNRELKIWLALRQYGIARYTQLIANHLALTRQLAAWVEEAKEFEVVSEPSLSICCFRFVPPELKPLTEESEAYLNDLNQAIEMALAEDGRALVSGTLLHGKRVLRACIINHRVTQAGVEETLLLLRELGYQLDKQLRTQEC
ncbi:MAG TPA: pyridoxal-dependent decarboxylase [Anaerolineae bacterium]|nr:pyridoxal-dependent decarboxylase [Anaerolineae bacterium]